MPLIAASFKIHLPTSNTRSVEPPFLEMFEAGAAIFGDFQSRSRRFFCRRSKLEPPFIETVETRAADFGDG